MNAWDQTLNGFRVGLTMANVAGVAVAAPGAFALGVHIRWRVAAAAP